jgi:23S rRNA (adenine2503-C2)-methyltransferase
MEFPMNRKESIYDLDLPRWKEFMDSSGEPAYRALQVWRNLYQQLAPSAEDMTDLPHLLRTTIAQQISFVPITLVRQLASSDGATWKYLFRLSDGALIESVRMAYAQRDTACISTQAGCGMGCLFCATGSQGLTRSLTAGEIIAQGIEMARQVRQKGGTLSNIVLMGMGEPFANYDATMEAVLRWMDPAGFGFGARRITISTVGLVPGILRFAAERSQVNLAISLHAANDAARNNLIPINRTFPLSDLMSACEEYIATTHRRISMEWALMHGINESDQSARELAALLHTVPQPLFHVNLILLNPVEGFSGQASSPERIREFQKIVERSGIPCTIRLRRGLDIAAGCGQLAARVAAES